MKHVLVMLGALLATVGPAAAWEPNNPAQPDGRFRSTTRIRSITQEELGGNFVYWFQTEDDTAAVCQPPPNRPRVATLNDEAAARAYIWVEVRNGFDRIYTQLLRLQSTGAPATLVIDSNCTLRSISG